MPLTVADILQCKTLNQAKIRAGRKGLDSTISSVTVGEVPDIAQWLSGGEAVLSTFFATSNDEKARVEFAKKIIESGAVCLLAKPKRFIGSLDPQIVALAEESDFPLIEVPHDTRWTEIIKEIYEKMITLETEIRLKGDFVDDLVQGQFQSEESLLERARFLGCDLSKGCLVLIVDIDNFRYFVTEKALTEAETQNIKKDFLSFVTHIISIEHPDSLASLKRDEVIIFLTPPKANMKDVLPKKAKKIAKKIQKGCSGQFPKFTVSVGLGRFKSKISQISKAYYEAKMALKINRRLGNSKAIVTFEDIGTYKLLSRLVDLDGEELITFYKETIAPLREYDEVHGTELVKTLGIYLEKNENINETAKELFSHRHTVRYRLRRIREIAGLDVFNSEDREKLSLGLKAMRLL